MPEALKPKYPIPDEPMASQPCWCGGISSRVVSRRDRWSQRLDTAMCLSCGTLRLEPRMTREQAYCFYNSEYEASHEPVAFFQRQQALRADLYLRPFLTGVRSILDYGCGPGGKLCRLADEGFEVFGYDPNPNFMGHAKKYGLRPWDKSGRYDCILLSHTIEHWIDPHADLAELFSRNLNPGGLAIVEVPLVDRLVLGVRRGGFSEETHLAHVWYFSVRTLTALMSRLGFRLVFTDRVTTCIFRHDRSGSAKKTTSAPWQTNILLAAVVAARHPLAARIIQRANRSIGYIDTQFRQRAFETEIVSVV